MQFDKIGYDVDGRRVGSFMSTITVAVAVLLGAASCGSNAPDEESDPGSSDAATETAGSCETDVDAGCGCLYQDQRAGVCRRGRPAPQSDDCREPEAFEETESTCDDELDNDCDGDVDCADSDCTGASCALGEGTAKCVDQTCQETNCADGTDNDQDGKTDCRDPDCTGVTCAQGEDWVCPDPQDFEDDESSCDEMDNDCDGTTDEGCGCTFDPVEDEKIDTDGDYGEGVCTDQKITDQGTCKQPSSFETRTDSESSCSFDDNDCDGSIDEGCSCAYDPDESKTRDTDDSHNAGVCSGQDVQPDGSCPKPGGFESETDAESECGGADNDCDGVADEGCQCNYKGTSKGVCSDGERGTSSGNCSVAPPEYESPEQSCDLLDNDCDGDTDEWGDVTCPSARLIGRNARTIVHDVAIVDGTTNQNKNGSVYAVGETDGSIAGQPYGGGVDGFIVRYDNTGNRAWVRLIGTSATDKAFGVSTDIEGSAYVTGFTAGEFPNETTAGSRDVFVTKYDYGGGPGGSGSNKPNWLTQLGSSQADTGKGIAVYNVSVYVAGSTFGTMPTAVNQGGRDGFVAKFGRTNGGRTWIDQHGTSSADESTDVDTDGSDVIVGGTTQGSMAAGISHAGADDGYLLTYDTSGSRNGTEQFGTSSDDVVRRVELESGGPTYLAGWTAGSLDGRTNSGGQDLFLRKFDSSGTHAWTRLAGSSSDEKHPGVALDGNGDVHVVGETGAAFGGATYNGGFGDVFTISYTPSGTRQNVRLLGTSEWDGGYAVEGSTWGHLVLGGTTLGDFGGRNSSGTSGASEGFVVEIN